MMTAYWEKEVLIVTEGTTAVSVTLEGEICVINPEDAAEMEEVVNLAAAMIREKAEEIEFRRKSVAVEALPF